MRAIAQGDGLRIFLGIGLLHCGAGGFALPAKQERQCRRRYACRHDVSKHELQYGGTGRRQPELFGKEPFGYRPTCEKRNQKASERQQDIGSQVVEQIVEGGFFESRDALERVPTAPCVERKHRGDAGEETEQSGERGRGSSSERKTPDKQRNHQFKGRNCGCKGRDEEQQEKCECRDRAERHLRKRDRQRDKDEAGATGRIQVVGEYNRENGQAGEK